MNEFIMLQLTKGVLCPSCKETNSVTQWNEKTRECYQEKSKYYPFYICEIQERDANISFSICPSCSKQFTYQDIMEQ